MNEIITGDCREFMVPYAPFDLLVVDPPYGDTALDWDQRFDGLFHLCDKLLKPTGSMWMFGSMRFFLDHGFQMGRFKYAQDIVWEKHNGSGFHADRFKRVHEHAVQFYKVGAKWSDVFNEVQTTPDATKKTARRKFRPPHMGEVERGHFVSEDGGPRLMRSVIYMRSCHGSAIHPTEKPASLVEILIRTSCPLDGLVGDPFAGSGAVGEAAIRAGRRYVGCEIDSNMADKANARLSGLLRL